MKQGKYRTYRNRYDVNTTKINPILSIVKAFSTSIKKTTGIKYTFFANLTSTCCVNEIKMIP